MYLEPNVHSTDAKIKMDIMSKENLCGEEKKKNSRNQSFYKYRRKNRWKK